MDPKYHNQGAPPTYPVNPPPVSNVIITTTNPIGVGPEPQTIVCPSCRSSVRTIMRYENTTKTHLVALILCLFICWPCVCLPYCMDSCRNGNHYCPNCGAFIGTYHG